MTVKNESTHNRFVYAEKKKHIKLFRLTFLFFFPLFLEIMHVHFSFIKLVPLLLQFCVPGRPLRGAVAVDANASPNQRWGTTRYQHE